ncbi:MAG TPA: stage III sporulation protein AF [Firmicutes bacterium]|nr:stage III sporulation protein AF [Bacillota bacterium]
MDFLRNWVRGIAVVSVLGGAAQLILPSGSMQKYVKVVFGFIIVLQLIAPLPRFMGHEDSANSLLASTWSENFADTHSFIRTYQAQIEWQVESIAKALPGVTHAKAQVQLERVTIGAPAVKRISLELKKSSNAEPDLRALRQWLAGHFRVQEENVTVRLLQ